MSAVANRICTAPAGGLGSSVQVAPPSAVASSSPLPRAQPCSVDTKLTSCTLIGAAAGVLGAADVDVGGVAAVTAGLATAEAVDGGAAAGLDGPQPASAPSDTSVTNAATIIERRL